MHKEGLETQNNFIKIFICFFVYLLGKLTLITITYISPCSQHNQLKYNFLTTVLTNKLFILTILFLQCIRCTKKVWKLTYKDLIKIFILLL